MGDYEFIVQTSNRQKVKVFFVALFVTLIIAALAVVFRSLLYEVAVDSMFSHSVVAFVKAEIAKLTPVGLFYAGLFGGFFFFPVPLELFFSLGLAKGNDPLISLFFMSTGFYLAQIVNYIVGKKFSPLVMRLISLKKVYKMRRLINKYGVYGVFLINVIPAPADIVTFALGLARYNVYRLFVTMIIANMIKFGAIILIYRFFS